MSGFGAFCPLPLRLGGSSTEGLVASQHARVAADVTANSRTLPFAWVRFSQINGDPSIPYISSYGGMNGVGAQYYPSIVALVPDSVFQITWDAVQSDAYEQPEPLAIHHAIAGVQGFTAALVSCDWNMGENVVTVYTFDNTGSPGFPMLAIELSVT